ncbi:phage tail protein [Acinetobacter seifertii]|jgi:phage tail sheath gpL-like|uniref:Phage tail protein n=1 Tax=Acinetobacter seifertii TaxID=1530123 RepID=A0A7H2XLN9_9GAMM|nr:MULTISPECIES: phage tail protein [Acinetobacter calcoaceticus/baumannii complex]EKV6047346.1 phage tail protein [Acinetobacter baumannii]MBD1229838.1 phage tail protein [Acinetobacter seifertii]MDN8176107.1 phage tail protein [Acinetobacter baumannii]MDN8249952.1 phage tail protein [Acinetobacter baumannii]MDV4248593.1 phage tail protein [Acinetobacter baumannii]
MSIPAGIKTPGVYTDVNINTLRTGLPANEQKVLFVTLDVLSGQFIPVDVYDTAGADSKFGKNSQAGRMIKAAVKTYRLVNAQAVALAAEDVQTQAAIQTESGSALQTEGGALIEPE